MILKDKSFQGYSKIISEHVDVEEGELISERLFRVLENNKNGIGLAAPQIGVLKRACVINVKEPIVLINPRIVEKSEETFPFAESCLSYPGKRVKTKRYVDITVEADNHEGQLFFSADSKDIKDAFECVCVQHEIDHLNGITMFDREIKLKPYTAPKKFKRNEKVTITNGKESKELKWKKAQPLIDTGNWAVYVSGPIT